MATRRNFLFFCSFLICLCWAEASKEVSKKNLKDSPGCRDAASRSRIICGEPAGENCLEDSCYTFNRTWYTWEESRKQCQKYGGDLVSIETKEELAFIRKKIKELKRYQPSYIGLTVEESPWEWESGKPLTYDRWRLIDGLIGGVSNGKPILITKIKPWTSEFYQNYIYPQASICELQNATKGDYCEKTSCYTFERVLRSWEDAKKNCRRKGGNLVSMETECEWLAVTKFARKYLKMRNETFMLWYIGLNKKPVTSWKWVNNASYTLGADEWNQNNPIGRSRYVYMQYDSHDDKMRFLDAEFACAEHLFICEKKIDYKPPEK